MTAPLRCHLLIGPPASGKTTLAGVLAELTGAQVLSTDRLLHQRIRELVADGVPVIVDATHARRPWRLAITQALALPAPVEWIGWWLYTSLATCLEWNHTRARLVPEPVIREMAAALADPVFGPSRAEGFAAVVAVVSTQVRELEPLLRDELARLDHRIRSARNRENRFDLHGYSRLLDLERLLYLLHLLSTYPELSVEDPATRAELEAIVSPLPEGDMAEQAAAYLRRLHGECYGDAAAIRADLAWLEANAFSSAEPSLAPIQLPPPRPAQQQGLWPGGVHGGYPPLGDAPVFQRVFTMLRHLLQQPFDCAAGTSLPEHLMARPRPSPAPTPPARRPACARTSRGSSPPTASAAATTTCAMAMALAPPCSRRTGCGRFTPWCVTRPAGWPIPPPRTCWLSWSIGSSGEASPSITRRRCGASPIAQSCLQRWCGPIPWRPSFRRNAWKRRSPRSAPE